FAVTPEEIQIVFGTAEASKSFTIQNTTTGDKIVYNSPTTASSATIYIRQNDDYIGYTSSVNNIHGLNVRQSRFDEFNIKNGDRLVVTPTPKSIRLKYEGAKLLYFYLTNLKNLKGQLGIDTLFPFCMSVSVTDYIRFQQKSL